MTTGIDEHLAKAPPKKVSELFIQLHANVDSAKDVLEAFALVQALADRARKSNAVIAGSLEDKALHFMNSMRGKTLCFSFDHNKLGCEL